VREALDGVDQVVLAVSGGIDSMVLLDAAAAGLRRTARGRLVVATFDHRTGPAAQAACALVEVRSAELGVRCVTGRAEARLSTEAALRDARWSFLRRVAASEGARDVVIATAHTRDDQIETALMRVLRGAGARGLAALYAASPIVRPLLDFGRSALQRYAIARGLEWVDDPSNASRRYLRNRIRHDVLPALRRVRPSVEEELIACSRAAARWRADVEAFVESHVDLSLLDDGASPCGLDVLVSSLTPYDRSALAVLWPAIASRVGLALDRRGIATLAAFSIRSRAGSRVQVAGGWTVTRSRDAFQLRASDPRALPDGSSKETSAATSATSATPSLVRLSNGETASWRQNGVRSAEWSFRAVTSADGTEPWAAWLPVDQPLWVRAWRPGDAMPWQEGRGTRKVKRFLSDARITGHKRVAWPVVLSGDEIVWIPGVRRAAAATARSGRPGLVFVCEYNDR